MENQDEMSSNLSINETKKEIANEIDFSNFIFKETFQDLNK